MVTGLVASSDGILATQITFFAHFQPLKHTSTFCLNLRQIWEEGMEWSQTSVVLA